MKCWQPPDLPKGFWRPDVRCVHCGCKTVITNGVVTYCRATGCNGDARGDPERSMLSLLRELPRDREDDGQTAMERHYEEMKR